MIRSRRVSEEHARFHALANKPLPILPIGGRMYFSIEDQMAVMRGLTAAMIRLDTCRSRPRCARYFIMGRAPGFRFERRRVTWKTVQNLVVRGYAKGE